MAIQSSCPACREQYRLPETQIGKRVRCRACGDTFLVQADEEVPVLEEATVEDLRKVARKPAPEVEELPELELDDAIEEDRPARRSRSVAPPPLPSRRRGRDDDDEEEEEAPKKGGSKTLFVVLGVVGALLFVCIGGSSLTGYMMTRSATNRINSELSELDKMAAEMDKDRSKFGQPPLDVDKGKLPAIDPGKDKDKIELPPVVLPPKEVEITRVDQAIDALRGTDKEKQRKALVFLQKAPVEADKRDEVARLLNPIIASKEVTNPRIDALTAAKTWATKDNFDELAAIIDTKDNFQLFTVNHAMEAVAAIGDDASIELLVKQFDNFFRVEQAGKCLERVGKKAEKLVVKRLHAPSTQIRGEAARLVKLYKTSDQLLVDQAIIDLDSTNVETRSCAVDTVLAAKPPSPEIQESVSKLLENRLTDNGFGMSERALRAMRVWATKDNIPALIQLCAKDTNKIGEVLKVFERFPDDEQVLPFMVAVFLRTPGHRATATKSLKAYGGKAETALLEGHLAVRAADPMGRRATYELLGEIGTKPSIARLKTFATLEGGKGGSKENAKVALAAIKTIQEREAKAAKDKDK